MLEQAKNITQGIYRIRNLINNKIYIGSSCTSLSKRFIIHKHYLRKNKHHSAHLQRAWNKYGEENFRFEIVELCNKELCLIREQEYIDSFNTVKMGYNVCPIAINCKGRKVSIKTRNKIAKTLRRNHRKGIYKHQVHTDQEKKATHDRHAKPVLQYDLNGNFIKEWCCQSHAAKETNCQQSGISLCCKNKARHRKFIWKFK